MRIYMYTGIGIKVLFHDFGKWKVKEKYLCMYICIFFLSRRVKCSAFDSETNGSSLADGLDWA